MEKEAKTIYEAPDTDILVVKTAGIICQSGGVEDYDTELPLEW